MDRQAQNCARSTLRLARSLCAQGEIRERVVRAAQLLACAGGLSGVGVAAGEGGALRAVGALDPAVEGLFEASWRASLPACVRALIDGSPAPGSALGGPCSCGEVAASDGDAHLTLALVGGGRRVGAVLWLAPREVLADPSVVEALCEASELIGQSLLAPDAALSPQGVIGERLLTHALEAAANGIIITDPRGYVEWVNPAFTSLTGYAPAEVLGRRTSFLRSGEQDPGFYTRMWTTISQGEVWRGQLVNRRKDGSLYDEEMTITPVRDEDGVIRHYIAIKQDISQTRRVVERLRESEERYRSLVDNLDDIIYATDTEGTFTFVNRAVTRYGFSPEQLIGTSIRDFVVVEETSRLEARRAQVLRSGATLVPMEYRFNDAQGGSRLVRVQSRPIVENGVTVGIHGIAVDITQQRETESQLRAAQKMEAVGRLAGGIAHDFNNILSVILSCCEIALMDLGPQDPIRTDLEQVTQAAQRAAGLTRQLLAFSRRQVLSPVVIEVRDLVTGLTKMLQRLIGEDITLTIHCAEALHPVLADRGQLEQVLMNLLVNARDAMPDGGAVTIGVRNTVLSESAAVPMEVSAGEFVEIAVTDTGVGMDSSTQSRIFEPFFTTKGQGKGTGLGLSMVYGIVRQSGGAVSVESGLGLGTTFKILLPHHDASRDALASRPPPPKRTQGDELVLVVEDEPSLRSVIRRALTASGYEVLVASNAEEALPLAERRAHEIDLVLTDVVMPGMNGRQLVERLKPICPDARVLYMTGYTDDQIAQHAMGEASVLRKPFDLATLSASVREVLDKPAAVVR